MEDKQLICDHLDITDTGNCKICGIDITNQEFIDSLPEAPENLNYLGDLMGIIQLAQATAREYARRNSVITNPKFRWVGTQLMRTSSEALWADVLQPSFIVAKVLGYRGDCERWTEVCKEYYIGLSSSSNVIELKGTCHTKG